VAKQRARAVPATECAAQADDLARNCIAEHCTDAPPPPPSCESVCEDQAAQAKEACMQTDAGEAACDAQAQGVLEQCLSSDCGGSPAPTCTEQCEITARAKYQKALGPRMKTMRAMRQAQSLFRRCAKSCDDGGTSGSPNTPQ